METSIDFDESIIYHQNPKLLRLLLKDQTTQHNICWATENYIEKGYMPQDEIKEEDIIHHHIIRPRVDKDKNIRKERTRERAEVFTPSDIVNQQILSVIEQCNNDKKWLMESVWMEITCGEAPYIVSRYDATTGNFIPCHQRVGFLDRKLQILQQSVSDKKQWIDIAKRLYKQSYGYEFHGDSLLIARENLFLTFIDYYKEKFDDNPLTNDDLKEDLEEIAEIISYNLIQVDGLTGKIPFSEYKSIPKMQQLSLFDDYEQLTEQQNAQFYDWNSNKINRFGGNKMKFDVVIGNPPYQLNDNGKRDDGSQNASATAIYPYFVEEAEKISQIQSIITPARYLYGAGKGTKQLKEKKLNDDSIQSLTVFNNASLAFGQSVSIKGGVAYFTRNSNYHGPAHVTIIGDTGEKTVSTRYLDENHTGVFIQSEQLASILSKVQSKSHTSFTVLVSARKPYGLDTSFLTNPKKNGKPDTLYDSPQPEGLAIYGLINGQRSVKYVSKLYPVDVNVDKIKKFNVQIPKASGNGKFGEVITNPFITKPNEIVTETFINIGAFDTERLAQNVLNYINTKFFRALLSIKKTTQDISSGKFEYVPLQDFTEDSDIDWTQSIHEIDQQLYEKYELSEDEIQYIEENVKEME